MHLSITKWLVRYVHMPIHVEANLSWCFLGAILIVLCNRASHCTRACQLSQNGCQQAQSIRLSLPPQNHSPASSMWVWGDGIQVVSMLVRQALYRIRHFPSTAPTSWPFVLKICVWVFMWPEDSPWARQVGRGGCWEPHEGPCKSGKWIRAFKCWAPLQPLCFGGSIRIWILK